MKLVINSLNFLVAMLYLLSNTSQQAIQAKELIPTANNSTIPIAGYYNYDPPPKPVTRSPVEKAFDEENLTTAVSEIEATWGKQYQDYFRRSFPDSSITSKDIANTLNILAKQTGNRSALIYVVPMQDQLELVIITPGNQPVHKRILQTNRQKLLEQVIELKKYLATPNFRDTNRYLPAAQKLYQWMIKPLETELETNKINNLILCMGVGLRTLPLAALHDGEKFLIEKYSLTRIPAFKLTDTLYTDLKKSQVLAMGASKFKDQNPLPAVPLELSTITQKLWKGKEFLNQDFTLTNLQSQRTQADFKIIHLATHADFQSGTSKNSYVQFWDTKLTLDQMSKLGWNNPPVELLVLSACRTAIGNEQAELGFAGLAVQSGAKSAIASLWYISDEGTLALMTQLYHQLQTAPIKAEALRKAQLAMLKGQVYLENGQLHTNQGNIALPAELAGIANKNLSHPYYWAAFTVVGSPW